MLRVNKKKACSIGYSAKDSKTFVYFDNIPGLEHIFLSQHLILHTQYVLDNLLGSFIVHHQLPAQRVESKSLREDKGAVWVCSQLASELPGWRHSEEP